MTALWETVEVVFSYVTFRCKSETGTFPIWRCTTNHYTAVSSNGKQVSTQQLCSITTFWGMLHKPVSEGAVEDPCQESHRRKVTRKAVHPPAVASYSLHLHHYYSCCAQPQNAPWNMLTDCRQAACIAISNLLWQQMWLQCISRKSVCIIWGF